MPDTLISACASRIERGSIWKPVGTRKSTSIVPVCDWPVSAVTCGVTLAAAVESDIDQLPGISASVRLPAAK